MKIIISERELNIVEETLKEFGLEVATIEELIGGEKTEITAEEISNHFSSSIADFNKFNSPVITLNISHYLADGSDEESYEFFISEEFIEDYYRLYRSTFRLIVNSMKDFYKSFKIFLVPMYNDFIKKWSNAIINK